jgi:hypothetical protein
MNSHAASDPNAVLAKLAINLPGTADSSQLPGDIQWMPPGEHEIAASRGGKPVTLTVKVDSAAAARVAESYRQHMAAAIKGAEDLPYFDLNHDDREASGHPTEFSWAGDDPQQGGVRAKLTWTGAGRQAVLGRSYRRFSPCFYVKENGEISGAPVNMGGLVNRAAFKRIAPIVSKAAESTVIASRESFEEKTKVVAKARNLNAVDAIHALAVERPDLYLEYRMSLGLGDSRQNARDLVKAQEAVEKRQKTECDEFLILSRALSEAMDIDLVQAATEICRARPALFERYRARLFGLDLDTYATAVAAVTSRAEESPFFAKSKAIAAARRVHITEAFDIVARENPELYDEYHRSL